jgi:hypothetical protein
VDGGLRVGPGGQAAAGAGAPAAEAGEAKGFLAPGRGRFG